MDNIPEGPSQRGERLCRRFHSRLRPQSTSKISPGRHLRQHALAHEFEVAASGRSLEELHRQFLCRQKHIAVCDLQEEVYVRPPAGFYPEGGGVWKLREAMCKLKTAPKAWATTRLRVHGGARSQATAESSVDDICAAGVQDSADRFIAELPQLLLVEHLGELRPSGKGVPLLGRILLRKVKG